MDREEFKINIPSDDNSEEIKDFSFEAEPSEEKDEFVIGQGFSFDGAYGDETVKAYRRENEKKKQKKGCLKSALWIGIVVVVAIAIGATLVTFLWDYLGLASPTSVEVVIEPGTSVTEIAEQLKDNGIIKMPRVFALYSKAKGYTAQYKYGLFVFSADDGYDDIADKLINEGAQAESVKVLIPEGATVDDIAKILEENEICTKSQFYDVVRNETFDFDFE